MIPRRAFLVGAAAAAALSMRVGADPISGQRAAIIGATGRGDYGHGLDVIFNDLPGVEVVAVADHDAQGREKARQRCGAKRGYADYREMLEKERPTLVSVAPRWTEEHHAMGMAALGAGAHVIMEKPIATTPGEADEILALASKKNLRIAVAHQMRVAPSVVMLKKAIDDGLVGELLEMRAWGKQDGRAGGE